MLQALNIYGSIVQRIERRYAKLGNSGPNPDGAI
jgi:hypothetical protein